MNDSQNNIESIDLTENIEILKDESPTDKRELIFSSNFLRGVFSHDVFKGKLSMMNDRPLISRKDSDEPTIYPEVNLMEENPPTWDNYKFTPTTNHNYNDHRKKCREIIEMIQK